MANELYMLIGFGIGLVTAFLCMVASKWTGSFLEPKEEKIPLRNIHYPSTPPPPSNMQLISQSIDQVAAVSTRLRRLAYDSFEELPLYRNLCLSLSALTDKAVQLMGKLLRLESQKEISLKSKSRK